MRVGGQQLSAVPSYWLGFVPDSLLGRGDLGLGVQNSQVAVSWRAPASLHLCVRCLLIQVVDVLRLLVCRRTLGGGAVRVAVGRTVGLTHFLFYI